MISDQKEGKILQNTYRQFENHGVSNPLIIKEGEHIDPYYLAEGLRNCSPIGTCHFDGPTKVKERWLLPLGVSEIELESLGREKQWTQALWDDYDLYFHEYFIMEQGYTHESSSIGKGCSSIETAYEWLLIYPRTVETDNGMVYSAYAAAQLDLNNPV